MGVSLLCVFIVYSQGVLRAGHTTCPQLFHFYRNEIAQPQAKAWLSHCFATHNSDF
jgi:hypothetical protein